MSAKALVGIVSEEAIQRQLALEEETTQLGIDRYRSKLKDAITMKKDITQLAPENELFRRAVQPLADFIRDAKMKRATSRFGKVLPLILAVDNLELAVITARLGLNAMPRVEPLQRTCIALGEEVRQHIEYMALKKTAPKLMGAIEKGFKKQSSSDSHRKKVLSNVKTKQGSEKTDWTEDEKFQVGYRLLDSFIETTGFLKIVDVPHKKGFIKSLMGTPAVMEWLKESHGRCELMAPLNLPMVCPPAPWEDVTGGGYLSQRGGRRMKLVRTRSKKALGILRDGDLTQVYRALNALQNTAWRINTFILGVLKEVWDMGGGLAGIPETELEPQLPPKWWTTDEEHELVKAEEPERYAAWRRETSYIYETWHRSRSKREAVRFKLWVADKFKTEPAIYMPWTCDWRGRVYPTPQYVNPQGDDSGKALIEFSIGKRLGERGVYWLAVHGANCFGVDKVSYDDRVAWVRAHEAQIKDCAENPLDGSRFWVDADDPFKFLAFCREWAQVMVHGEDFESHIPVALDGSSNGLQHFSALLRDERGGRSVCLVPGDKPADIYAEVAAVSSRIIEEDCRQGNEIAALWQGKVTRKITKRNVMTTPYGVSAFGRVDQLLEELKKEDVLGCTDQKLQFAACRYLAEVNGRAISEVVKASHYAMEWLQEVAKVVQGGITWTTPTGFRPHQEYKQTKTKRVETYWGGMRIDLSLMQDTDKDDVKGNVNGIAPNFVHSLDAAHCIMTINKCVDAGITNFAMIHDSYGTHAADTEDMHRLLREAFVEMHSEPLLEKFRQEVMEQTGKELPPIPTLSETPLDLNIIRRSAYFFS